MRNEREYKRVKERKIISSLHVLVEGAFLSVSLPQRICLVCDLDSVLIKKKNITIRKRVMFGLQVKFEEFFRMT